jgi:hypothetical protein
MILQRVPTVAFDPSNKTHRAAVRAFLKRRAWLDSPLRFSHDPAFGSVADQVTTKLLEWYADREENGTKKPSQLKLDI